MTCKHAWLIVISVSLTWLAGCTSTPGPSVSVLAQPVQRPDLPAQVMDSEIPDYLAWMESILSSSMSRLGLSSPATPSPPVTQAKP
jgi:hypothetical protein